MAKKPTFATPLPQSTRSDVLEWRFPRPYGELALVGKSRAAWHTSFVVPRLDLLLDAGLVVDKLRPKHVFITHGHSDHSLLAPVFAIRENPPDIYCPAEAAGVLDDFLEARTMLNLGGLVTKEEAANGAAAVEEWEDDLADAAAGREGRKKKNSSEEEAGTTSAGGRLKPTHITHGIRHGDVVPLRRLRGYTATAFACDHTVPCLGYVFRRTTQRLRPEYVALPGPEIANLRRAGVDIAAPHTTSIFAFLGDTTAATLAAAPDWLSDGIPVVVTECSFLYEHHRAQADRTKHTLWTDLEPVVRRWPRTTFVLMHFSMRYTDAEVRAFFSNMEDPPTNIVVWADGEEG